MEFFDKIVNGFPAISTKTFILDGGLGSEYASVIIKPNASGNPKSISVSTKMTKFQL